MPHTPLSHTPKSLYSPVLNAKFLRLNADLIRLNIQTHKKSLLITYMEDYDSDQALYVYLCQIDSCT